MRVLICGDRKWEKTGPIYALVAGLKETHAGDDDDPLVIVHGAAPGADTIAGQAAEFYEVEVEAYPADWQREGRSAGPRRNQRMLTEGCPEVAWAFHDDLAASKGTKDMVTRARKAGIPVYLVSRVK